MTNLEEWPWPAGTLMARLSPGSRRDLLGLGTYFYKEPGTVLMRQGDPVAKDENDKPGDSVYLLRSRDTTVSACVKITAATGELLAIRVSGDVIGELAVLDRHSARPSTATVCTKTIAHCIPGPVFRAFLARHEDGWPTLCWTLADRLAWSDQRRLDFRMCQVHIRLARLLVQFVESHGRPITLVRGSGEPVIEASEITVQLSYEDLGNLIGARVHAVGRAMQMMRDKDLVCLHNRHIVILDRAGLEDFGELSDPE
ncbi:Crp/Fnr family transcriptional regulator [Nocardia sp. NPDC006630]|uniref:Crp/Fnr family transcriptional regulator n=1 Tax=Nocardia sp. NPDC006630 TaxID=3157181 RepID=UPI0033A95EB9